MHASLIEKESFIEGASFGEFTCPTTIEEVEDMLPGKTQFNDINDLLILLGKQHNRAMLHSFASKLFLVPHRHLVNAEKDRQSLIPNGVLDAVYESRKRAKEAAAAAASDHKPQLVQAHNGDTSWPKAENPLEQLDTNFIDGTIEYADPEHACEYCLPIYGDEIIGTRPEGGADITPKVHRVGCPYAQRVINRTKQQAGGNNYGLGQRVDSVSLRRGLNNWMGQAEDEIPVKLEWAEATEEDPWWFLCEIVVHCEDRKLLLADCSEVVSELSVIIKTGSQTTDEHATLVFLVNVQGLEDLQTVMDSLRQIRSVMSVERRVRM